MNRHLQQALQKAYKIPIPDQQEKARFMRTLPRSRISTWQFILTQIAYFRKWTLVLSMLFLLPALLGARHIDPDTLWIISSLIPFLGLLAVAESTRSAVVGMQEFEMSTRFSLKSVILAKMSVLGILDILILCCLIPLCHVSSNISLLQTGLYLLAPYLLTVNISLCLTRRLHSGEAIYSCMFTAVLVSTGSWLLHLTVDFIYQLSYLHWWILLSVFLTGRMMQEIYRTVRQTEEYV